MASPNSNSAQQLARLVGLPNAPEIVDVSIDEDFQDDPYLVPGARRWSHQALDQFVPRAATGRLILVCQKGQKLSQGAAALLRNRGFSAEYLEGGNLGWRDGGLPRVDAQVIDGLGHRPTRWVTRHRPKVDRIACAWLITRFIDPAAEFLYVSPSAVEAVANKFDAIPFDIAGTRFGHHGDECSFDALLQEFGLDYPPLNHLALLVRGADTERLDLAPQAAGLLAVSLGLSRMYKDDNQQLDAGLLLYDALYRWCRDAVDETHDLSGHDQPGRGK